MKQNRRGNARLSLLMALRLAAPHTWAASLIPALLGAALTAGMGVRVDTGMLLCLTAACVFMQAAANTFNDYSDYIKGTDTLENSPEAYDAVLVYDKPSTRSVLLLGFLYLLCAAAFGLPAILRAGWRPLMIGFAGAAVLLLYSFGKTPLSYLPLGELCSGFVMGGLIPLAVTGVLSGNFRFSVLLDALPVMLGVSLIMLTNNGCDIKRDSEAGRRTFAVLLGQEKTAAIYRGLLLLWAALPIPLLLWRQGSGALVYLIAFLPAYGHFSAQLRLKLGAEGRASGMAGIAALNTMLGLAYIVSLLFRLNLI